jgi:hypothetical protein
VLLWVAAICPLNIPPAGICSQCNLGMGATTRAQAFGPALLFVLMLRVHLFDDCKLGDVAAGQLKSHRPPLGMV